MNVVLFWKNELRVNRGVLIGLSLLLTLAVALAVAASETRSMLRTASAAAAERFDLLVGAKASPTALLFGTVYLRDEALPIVPAETLKLFQDQKDVRWAHPSPSGTAQARRRLWAPPAHSSPSGATFPSPEGESFPRALKPWRALLRGSGSATKSVPCTDAFKVRDMSTTRTSESWAWLRPRVRPGTAPY